MRHRSRFFYIHGSSLWLARPHCQAARLRGLLASDNLKDLVPPPTHTHTRCQSVNNPAEMCVMCTDSQFKHDVAALFVLLLRPDVGPRSPSGWIWKPLHPNKLNPARSCAYASLMFSFCWLNCIDSRVVFFFSFPLISFFTNDIRCWL